MSSCSASVRFAHVLGLCVLLGGFVPLANANAFLRGVGSQDSTAILSDESEQALLEELEVALGNGHRHATEKRLKRIEQRLSPMFGAMPKNEHGKLGPSAGGYMLHRLFVQRHGWFIRALEPKGESWAAWNKSTPTSALEERLPEHVVSLFEKRLGVHGLGMKELAILAATLEHLVHTEALERLKVAYLGQNMKADDVLSEEEALKVLDMYMAIYIQGFFHSELSTMTAKTAQTMHEQILEVYPAWPETQQFLRETFKSVAPKRDYLYFNEMENVIAEIGERYGRFQDTECRQMKDWLVASEDPSVGGAGRVRIADFYKKALNEGKYQFSESMDYLRQLGALDESDASNPRVLIPNYISGPSNCLASSSFYSVCCLDECESILGRLEETLSASEATPSMITSLVATIPSATMPGNRTLSPWLHQRLDEVAQHHGGIVPLHGRLFAQWLHYAFPRECQFPHVSGTTNPQRQEDLLKNFNATKEQLSTSESEMQRVVKEVAPPLKHRTPGTEVSASEESGMWVLHEELVVWRPQNELQLPLFERFGYVRGVLMLGAALSLSVAAARRFQLVLSHLKSSPQGKFYV